MIDYASDLAGMVWDLRLVILAIALLVFIGLWLDTRAQRNSARAHAARMLIRNAELVARTDQLQAANADLRRNLRAARRTTARRPIIAGRVVS